MNSALFYLAIFNVGICLAEEGRSCPAPKLPPLQPFSFNKFLGTWFAVRGTPCTEEGMPEMECLSDTYWVDSNQTDAAITSDVNLLFRHRTNGTQGFYTGSIKVSHLSDGLVDNNWIFTMFGASMPSLFLETDNGHSWAIWYACNTDPSLPDPTPMWFIMSRTPTMDSKLEQILVEKVEQYSGMDGRKLRGVQQTNCY